MSKLISPLLVLAALAAILAGCGGGSKSSSSSSTTSGGSASSINGVTVGDCLNNDENFLVQPTTNSVDGQSPAGVGFTLTFYKSPAAAQAAAAKKNKKTTAVVEMGVVDFHGNPAPGSPAAKISPTELAAIKRCIDKSK